MGSQKFDNYSEYFFKLQPDSQWSLEHIELTQQLSILRNDLITLLEQLLEPAEDTADKKGGNS